MNEPKKTCDTCDVANCPSRQKQENESSEQFQQRQKLQSNLCRIKHKIMVFSGKGGVGKSTVAANLAVSLSLAGKQVGLMDIDIHGPSIPRLLGLEGSRMQQHDGKMLPIEFSQNLKVMSIGFMLPEPDSAVIWRGPLKMGVIRQFLADTQWGDLDYLVVDSPPGTGDEPLSVCQLVGRADGAVIVTTPQEVALNDVRKCIDFCRKIELPVLGVIENMSGFVCPRCGEVTDIFKRGGAENMARDLAVPFLGRIPLDPQVTLSGDEGKPFSRHYPQTETAAAFGRVVEVLVAGDGG